MISQPLLSSAICSEIPVPPYTQTTWIPRDLVNFLHSDVICIASSLVGVIITAGRQQKYINTLLSKLGNYFLTLKIHVPCFKDYYNLVSYEALTE